MNTIHDKNVIQKKTSNLKTMKTLHYSIYIAAALFYLFSSCSKDDEEQHDQQDPINEAVTPVEAMSRFLTLSTQDREPTTMKIDGFLKVPDIPGESKKSGHEDEIEILSVSFGMELHVLSQLGGSGSGRVEMRDLLLKMSLGEAARQAMEKAASSKKKFPEVRLTLAKNGSAKSKYLSITMKDAIVSSYSTNSVPGSASAEESVSFTFQEIIWTAY